MRKLVALGALVLLSFAAADARAVTIDITLAPRDVSTLGEVTFIIGVRDDAGSVVDINAYTLDYQDAFVTPEPSTGLLMAFGLGGLAMMGRRRHQIP